jgi:uncharacterized protein (TIGR02679 family)
MATDLIYLANDTDLKPLWDAVHDRLCAGASPEALATVRVTGLNRAGLAQLRSWLDTSTRRRRSSAIRSTGDSATVPLRELLTVLDIPISQLATLVELAAGKSIVDRSSQARASAARRDELWQHAASQLPTLPQLIIRMRTVGIGEDTSDVRTTIAALAAVLGTIPVSPPIPLAKLAHDTVGNPHFFDLDQLAGKRLVAAVAEHTGRPAPTRPDLARALLAESGIIADRLSATVLVLNARVVGDGPIDQRLRDSTTPVALTLLDLVQHPPRFAAQTLTVVENPSVLEVAYLNHSKQALACTSGHLRAVDHTLFRLAVEQGIRLRYAGDIDDVGQHIAGIVADTYGAEIIAMDPSVVAEARTLPPAVVPPDPVRTATRPTYQEHDAVLKRILD